MLPCVQRLGSCSKLLLCPVAFLPNDMHFILHLTDLVHRFLMLFCQHQQLPTPNPQIPQKHCGSSADLTSALRPEGDAGLRGTPELALPVSKESAVTLTLRAHARMEMCTS